MKGKRPAAVIGTQGITELERDRIGAGFQLHLHRLGTESVMVPQLEELIVDAQDQIIVPGQAESG